MVARKKKKGFRERKKYRVARERKRIRIFCKRDKEGKKETSVLNSEQNSPKNVD